MSEKRKRAPLTPEEQQYARNLIETYDGVIRQTISRWLNPELRGEFEDVVQSVYEAICVQLNDFGLYQSPQALIITITQRAVWRLHKDRKANKETVPLPDDYPANRRTVVWERSCRPPLPRWTAGS